MKKNFKIVAQSHDTSEYAPLFYYLGTGYGILADHCRKMGAELTGSAVMKYRKQSFFYMRKAIDFIVVVM